MISFSVRPLYNDSCDQARTFGASQRAFSYEHQILPGEPRQSLPMNYGQGVFITTLRSAFGSGGCGSPPGLMNDGVVQCTFIQDSFIAHPGHLHLNYAADRINLDPPGLVIEPSAGRPLPMNDGQRAIGGRTIADRPGLTYYSIVKNCLSKESRFATWEL